MHPSIKSAVAAVAAAIAASSAAATDYPSPTYQDLTVLGTATMGSATIPFTQTGTGAAARTLDDRAKETLSLLDFRTSPAQGNGIVDDGPMFRAAIAECARTGSRRLYIPPAATEWHIASVDAHGCGMSFGDDSRSLPSCHLEGEARNTGGGWTGGVNIKLANGVNRPLVCIRDGATSPIFENIRFDGNRTGQTGWSGGPEGKLYTIQVEAGSAPPESSLTLRNVQLTGGYNGNLYIGAGRGSTRLINSYSEYSGQGPTDVSIYFNGMDADLIDFGVGSTTGIGVLFNEGSQYHWSGGATWMNETGTVINGAKVEHLSIDQVNFQYSYCTGLIDNSAAPFSGKQAGGHVLTNAVFEGNSKRTSGACPDIYVDRNSLLSLVNPIFNGSVVVSDPKPNYNISTNGSATVKVTAPTFATTPNTVGKFQFPNAISCANCVGVVNSWTPSLYGETTAGSPTYTVQTGRFTRSGSEVTVRFAIQVTSLGGATGNLRIGGLPVWSRQNSSTDIGYCTISLRSGWTAAAGFNTLTAFIQQNENSIRLYDSGSGVASAPATAAEFAASSYIHGACTYPTN